MGGLNSFLTYLCVWSWTPELKVKAKSENDDEMSHQRQRMLILAAEIWKDRMTNAKKLLPDLMIRCELFPT